MIFNGNLWIPLANIEEDEMADFQVAYKAHNVNSKRLLQRLVSTVEETSQEFIFQRTSTLSKTYDFSQLVSYLEAYFEEMQEDKVVNKFDVIGDFRNNTMEQMRNGAISIDVRFQQFNCINITNVVFSLTKI